MASDERTALYRLFGVGDELLYIGVAKDPLARWSTHARLTTWWPDVLVTRIEWFASRPDAEASETAAIEAERPKYNLRSVRFRGMPVERARKVLGQRVKRAKEDRVHTVLTMRGNPDAVIVPMSWYRTKVDEPIEYVPAERDDEEAATE